MNNELKPYPEYKDSGFEWIGNIPKNWGYMKLKRIASVELSNIDKKSRDNEIDVVLCNYVDVYYNNIITPDLNFMKATAKQSQIDKFKLRKGTVLITKDSETPNDIGVPAWVSENMENVICGYHLAQIKPSEKVIGKYLFYMLLSSKVNEQLHSLANGVTRYGISKSDIENSVFLVPKQEIQKSIINFLDQKTSEIDALISDKEKLITLLEEKRQAVITETVTKGLDPNVKMKDSGIEWIGEIPEHWEVVKLKHLSNHSFKYGANESAESDNPNQPRYIRITDLTDEGNLKNETFKSLPFNIAEKYPVEKGDILFARSGATVGKTYIHKSDEVASYAGYLIRYRPSKKIALPEYIYYFTKSLIYREWIERSLIQATIENISAEKYANLKIPLTNTNEQGKIIKFLNEYYAETDDVLNHLNKQITKLKEYRESLIYEAVTGKIDLRNYGEEPELLVAERGEPYGN